MDGWMDVLNIGWYSYAIVTCNKQAKSQIEQEDVNEQLLEQEHPAHNTFTMKIVLCSLFCFSQPLFLSLLLLSRTSSSQFMYQCNAMQSNLILSNAMQYIPMHRHQIYKHLDIGSNKPSLQDMADVPHHMVDLIEPNQGYSSGDFVRNAAPIIYDILKRGKVPGTFLY